MKLDEIHQKKLDEYQSTDDKKEKVRLGLDLCHYLQNDRNVVDMLRLTDEILPLAEELSLKISQYHIFFYKGEAYMIQGDLANTEIYFKKAMDIAEELQTAAIEAHICYYMAILEYQKENNKESLKYNLKAIEIYKQNGMLYELVDCYDSIAGVYIQLEKYDEAMSYYKKAINITKPSEQHFHILKNMGVLFIKIKDYPRAQKNLKQALNYHRKTGVQKTIVHCLSLLCQVNTETGNYDLAIEYGLEMKDIAKEHKFDLDYFISVVKIAHAYDKSMDRENAKIYFDEALALKDKVQKKAWVEYLYECLEEYEGRV